MKQTVTAIAAAIGLVGKRAVVVVVGAGLIMVFAAPVFADHVGAHATPCNEADTVGGGQLGNSPGPTTPATSLGWDVGTGQCNGSFTVTRDVNFPSFGGIGIELGLRIEQRSVGQVQRNGGNDYQVELGNDTTSGKVDESGGPLMIARPSSSSSFSSRVRPDTCLVIWLNALVKTPSSPSMPAGSI